jgi:uncharacterized protein YacL
MNPPYSLRLARFVFVFICALLGLALSHPFLAPWWQGMIIGGVFGGIIASLDMGLGRLTLNVFSSATFGLMIGVLCAWLVTRLELPGLASLEGYERIRGVVELAIYISFGFLGVSLALRSNREEFALIIPYVRFRQDAIEEQKLLVDSNVLIDGRIPGVCETGFLTGTLMVPRFVLDELHLLADSHEAMRKERGKRGLECLEQLRKGEGVAVRIHEDPYNQADTVDGKLVLAAKQLGARLLTNDANLGRVASLQGVTVLNMHLLSRALRPALVPGEELDIMLSKPGKEPHQAVGYLPDGTMIVVNQGAQKMGAIGTVTVISSLQTSAGRLVFAELKK